MLGSAGGVGGGGAGGAGGGAGRGRGRPSDSLRMPRSAQDDNKPKSTLSAEAKEWFPPNYVPPTTHDSTVYYEPDSHFEYDNFHPVYFAPEYEQNYTAQQPFSVQSRLRFHQNAEQPELQTSLSQLMSMLDEVTYSPGRFATLSGPLVDSFSSTLDKVQHTQPLVDAIVNQAIKEPNFRYNGARLCTMFDSVELREPSVFRPCLLERCANEEFSIINGTDISSDDVCGFAMFLAELYMQFENPEGGRIKALGGSLCKILKHMLTTLNNNATKAVCQILKLSGLALDADCKLLVDDIFFGLRSAEEAGVQVLLVRNLINLRQNRWGSGGFAELVDSDTVSSDFQSLSINNQPEGQRNVQNHPPRFTGPASTNRNHNPYRGSGDNGGGMFYLPDGHALTSEEAAFLNQHLPQSGDQRSSQNGDHNGDSDPEIWEPELDDEQHADFMEFLRLSHQISR